MRTRTLSKAPLAAIAAALAAAAIALAFAFSLPAAFASGESKAFTVTTEITATYDKDGAITVPDVKLTNDTGSAVVLKSAKMNSDYEFVSCWTNDAAGKVVAAGETVTIKWSANGSKVPDGWGKGEKVRVGAVAYTYEPVDAAPADKIDISGASIETEGLVYNGQSQTARIKSVTLPDGTVLSEGDYHVSSGGTGTDAGTYGALTIQGDGNYTGTATGSFTISPRQMTEDELGKISLDVPAEGYTYDGKAKAPAVKGIPAGLAEGADYVAAYSDNVNAGAAKATITFKGNYAGSAERVYQIAKRSVTLASASASKTYDGTPLTDNSVTVSGDGFAEGEGATYDVTGSITDAGSVDNKFAYALNKGTNAANYSIEPKYGTLTVAPVADEVVVTVAGHKGGERYTGSEQAVSGYDVSADNELYDAGSAVVLAGEARVSATDAGTYPMGLNADRFKNASGNFSNVRFAVTDGELTIGKKAATIAAGSAEKEYDGKALVTDAFETSGFVKGQGIASATVEGSQTLVGSSASTVKKGSWKAQDGTDLNNYDIATQAGTLTVKDRAAKYQISLEGVAETTTYDGSVQSMSGVKTDRFIFDGVEFTVANYKSDIAGKDAGEYVQTITSANEDGHWTVKDAGGNDVSAQFAVTAEPGKLVIAPKAVTVASGSAEKTYDGAALTKEAVTVTAGGFAEGEEEGVSYAGFASLTDAGSTDNAFDVVFDGEKAKAGNYSVTKVPGKLTVSPVTDKVTVTVKGNTGTATYDGSSHSVEGYTVSIDGSKLYTESLVKFDGIAKAEGTDAGTYYMGLKAEQFSNTSKNFNNVEFSVTDGSFTISKRDVTLKSADLTKPYDGTALANGETALATESGWVEGQGAKYTFTGSQTLVDSSANAFSYELKKGTKADNYNIAKSEGELKVTDRADKYEITVTAESKTVTYNGAEQTVSGVTGTSYTNDKGVKFTVTGLAAEAKGTNAGTYANNITGTPVVKDPDGNDVAAQFTVKTENGSLVINQKTVSVAWDSEGTAEYIYDGQPKAPTATIAGAEGLDVLRVKLSYYNKKNETSPLDSVPSDSDTYIAKVTAFEGEDSILENYTLSEAGISKDFTIKDGYWLAEANADSPESNVLKTAAQIAEDMAVLHDARSATSASKDKTAVTAEYTNYMQGKSADSSADKEVRLYTRWNDTDATEDADKYVEFRIIQVGEHDGDGSALTFAATHSLPAAQVMNTSKTNEGGWASSHMRTKVFGANGYVAMGLSDLVSSKVVKAVNKTTAYRASGSGDWSVSSDERTTSDSFWLLSNTEVFGDSSETNKLISDGCFELEGSQYAWFKAEKVNAGSGWATSGNSAIAGMYKTRSGSNSKNSESWNWWLRSPRVGGSNGSGSWGDGSDTFGDVGSVGEPYDYYAWNAFSVVPAFAM